MTEFIGDLFSVTYPAGWVALESEDGSGLLLANSESGLARYRQGAVLEAKDQALYISLTPAALFRVLQLSIEPGASAGTLSLSILTKVAETTGTEAGPPKVIRLEDGREVAIRKAAKYAAEGAVALFEVAEGIIVLGLVVGFPGEYEAAEASALAILTSLKFNGTAEALTAAIDPAPPMAGPVR